MYHMKNSRMTTWSPCLLLLVCLSVAAQRETTEAAAQTLTTEDNVIELTQVTSDFINPTHSVITCQVTANQNVRSISFMEIVWQGRQLVYANTTTNGGLATEGPSSFGNIIKVSGKVNQTHPEESQLMVDIAAETCVDAATGHFACVLRYSDFNSSATRLARAQLVAPDPCDSPRLQMSVINNNGNNPTGFSLMCQTLQFSDVLLSLELILLPDKPLTYSGRRKIAYYDGSSSKQRVLNPDLADKGAYLGDGHLSVYFTAGTCEDTGVYRCKAVYLHYGENIVKMMVNEARKQACLPGAVATVERHQSTFESYEKFVCRVDPTLVVELVSLEVSVVRNGSRLMLAYINSFFNNKVSVSSGHLQVQGEIYPFAPAASSLNVTSLVSYDGRGPSYITSCKAVYTPRNPTFYSLVQSFTDDILLYFS